MAYRIRRLGQLSTLLPRFCASYCYHSHGMDTSSLLFSIISPSLSSKEIYGRSICNKFHISRFSTTSELSYQSIAQNDLLSFLNAALDEVEGPDYCWLNISEQNKHRFNKNGVFLVLVGQFHEMSNSDNVILLQKVKFLQQRFPLLHVIGFHRSGSSFAGDKALLVQLVVKEYITFPILLSKKHFFEVTESVCLMTYKNFKDPVFYYGKDTELGYLKRAIEELHVPDKRSISLFSNWNASNLKQVCIKEPHLCSFMNNFLFHFPGCVSADQSGNRIFFSNSNNHRIIICDGTGKIHDSIGSIPGFEDGGFESAKLARPAASFYDAIKNYLYFVDSENHAIRRADLDRRVLETVHPTSNTSKKSNRLWTWIMENLGAGDNSVEKAEEIENQSLMFPWHLIKSVDNEILILNQSFATLWIMDLNSGEIKEEVKEPSKILEICGQLIAEKLSPLKHFPQDWLQQKTDATCAIKGLPFAGLISSLTTFQNHVFILDMDQGILKLDKKSRDLLNFRFSNLQLLGLPYWCSLPLERVLTVASADGPLEEGMDHFQHLSLLPGRTDIQLNIDLPADTELVEPLQESCIWRQARGTATVVSELEAMGKSLQKVGIAQKWYDELDNLPFSEYESDLSVEVNDNGTSDTIPDRKIQIDCAVNTSPGKGEVIIYAALYLKLKKNIEIGGDNHGRLAERIANSLYPKKRGVMGRNEAIEIFVHSKMDLREVVFIKPLHIRLRLDCADHPKADNTRDIILTDTAIEVDISLNS